MSQVIKTYLGIFMLLLLSFTAFAMIQMQLSVVKAQDFHAAVVSELSNSHFSQTVVEGCSEQAKMQGYTLQLQPIKQQVNGREEVYLMEVTLQYPFRMGMLRLDSTQQIRGYAR